VALSCVEDFSFNWVLGTRGTCGRSTRVNWAHQDWVIPFFTASVSYRATQLLVSTGFCVICAGSSPSRTGCLISLWCPGSLSFCFLSWPCDLKVWFQWTGKGGKGYIVAQHRHLLIWQNFFCGLQGSFNLGQWRFEDIHLITSVCQYS